MTDNEIIKALECCIEGDCDNCPWDEQTACNEYMKQDALDLINRQNAEIGKCENIIRLADKTIEKQSAEIERLNGNLFTISNACKQRRDEAVKEFAERLKGLMLSKYCVYFNAEITEVLIDNLVKEMVGEG